MFRVGINAHLLSGQLGYRRAGIHHYIVQVLRHLPSDSRLTYIIFSGFDGDWARPDFVKVTPPWNTENRLLRILWEQSVWPLDAKRHELDLLHSMAFVSPIWQPCPTTLTIYDLSFLHFPERFPALQRRYLQSQTRRSCHSAKRIVTISESGREDVHAFFGIPRDRIDVVQPGVDVHFRPYPPEEVADFRERQQLPEQFLLHVGTLQPRKNIPILLEALARLNRPRLPLVLVGGKGWQYEEIFERIGTLGLHKQVRLMGYVPDRELPLWYSAASALVFPSLYEGFGLPIVEAMACGTPVIAANSSSIPEAAGDAALLFEPTEVDVLVNHLLTVLDNRQQAATMRKRGLVHASRFTWDSAGVKMAQAFLSALSDD
ncbi:MAG TPA: glycosyltransferase family 1 protein [Candidatus Binatia bacterium]|jgi:glycosyltransferase involved in cell wall biosynthesis|nr:glycosyltransferase family 1 protein [Candidatus Binatia bacterium]